MKTRPLKPYISPERGETLRQGIIKLLMEGPHNARDISAEVGVMEKEVVEHLEHIRKTFHSRFVVKPAECRRCGFSFTKRDRLKKPGRCPMCHSESVSAPLYSIKGE